MDALRSFVKHKMIPININWTSFNNSNEQLSCMYIKWELPHYLEKEMLSAYNSMYLQQNFLKHSQESIKNNN